MKTIMVNVAMLLFLAALMVADVMAGKGGTMPREQQSLFHRYGACSAVLVYTAGRTEGGSDGLMRLSRDLFDQADGVADGMEDGGSRMFMMGVTFGAAYEGMVAGNVTPTNLISMYGCKALTGGDV